MGSLVKIKKNKLVRQLDKSKEAIMSVFVFLVFLVVSAVIVKDINPAKESVPDYFELSKNPYVKYEELLSRTDLKKIMDDRQFLEMRYNENIIKEKDPFERDDPFMKKFGDEYKEEYEYEYEYNEYEHKENSNEDDENDDENENNNENENEENNNNETNYYIDNN